VKTRGTTIAGQHIRTTNQNMTDVKSRCEDQVWPRVNPEKILGAKTSVKTSVKNRCGAQVRRLGSQSHSRSSSLCAHARVPFAYTPSVKVKSRTASAEPDDSASRWRMSPPRVNPNPAVHSTAVSGLGNLLGTILESIDRPQKKVL